MERSGHPSVPAPSTRRYRGNGQVTAIAVNPNNTKMMYIGTAWGGVWRTRDGGTTWTPIFDHAPSLGIGEPGAIAIDPVNTNIIYAGTSNREGSQFSGNATQPGAGLFKSTDAGASWVRLGSGYPSGSPSNANIFFNQNIDVVIVDPANRQIVYLASNFGFFVSTDGGLNWTRAGSAGLSMRWCLDPTSPAARAHPVCGDHRRGRRAIHEWRTELDDDPEWHDSGCRNEDDRRRLTGFGKVVVALAPPTSPAQSRWNPGDLRYHGRHP